MDAAAITHLSFDCYGTLIDWERGILAAALPILARAGVDADPAEVLRAYVRHEAALEAGPYRPYRAVLAEAMRRIGADLGVALDERAGAAFAAAHADWPPFDDTVEALARLGARFRLVILSNVDDALFARTAQTLRTEFAAAITAEQVGAYKPALDHFHAARDRLGLHPDRWLHVAQSLYHDHVPARALGLQSAWVDRASRLPAGLAPPVDLVPSLRVTTLAELADLLA